MHHRIAGLRFAFVFAFALLLPACWAVSPPPVAQTFDARGDFNGKPLELAQAVDRKDAAAVRRLIHDEHIDPDTVFTDDAMPLVAWPVLNENAEGLHLLLENGADPNARKINRAEPTHSKNNAMVFAAGLEDQTYLKLLLDHGGDPNTVNSNDDSLTYEARLKGHWPNVQLLIERGANVNYSRTSGGDDTVMAWYSRLGDFEQVYWLLEHGGDPTLRIKGVPGTRRDGAQAILEDIFYLPVQPHVIEWQRKCQRWVLDRGIKRPPMSNMLKKDRKTFGLPTEEKDIPQG